MVGPPGLIRAIGIISVVLGSLGIVVSGGSMMFRLLFTTASIKSASAPVSTTTAPPLGKVAAQAYVAPNGLPLNDRGIIIEGLSQIRPLSEPRRQQLDALLADEGATLFSIPTSELTSEKIVALVTGSHPESDGSGGAPMDVYEMDSGSLKVSDQSAVFFPQSTTTPVRVEGGSVPDDTGRLMLTSAQIDAIVARVDSLTGGLTDQQAQALRDRLKAPDQNLITPSLSQSGAVEQILSATRLNEGSTVIVTATHQTITLGIMGDVADGAVPLANTGPGAAPNRPHVTHQTAALLLLEALASVCMATFLLIIGILTLKQSPHGRKLHYLWAIAKLILVPCSAIASLVMWTSMPGSENAGYTFGIGGGILTLIYPIALLFALSSQTVRSYYSPLAIGHVN
jgi:hypothetical protein